MTTVRKKAGLNVTWIGVAITLGITVIGWIGIGATFYATTNSTLNHHEETLKKLNTLLESEAVAREKIREQYMTSVGKQTELFSNLTKDLAVQGTKYEMLVTSVNKLGEKIDAATATRK